MFVVLLLSAVSCSDLELDADPEPAADEPVEAPGPLWDGAQAALSIEGSTVVLTGDMDTGFYEHFLRTVGDRKGEITVVRVNSPGGVTDEGRKLGDWIFDRNIDVVVDGFCFSSCANYVFTAARNKTILADSIVGWHGSEQQDEHIARGLGVTVEEFLASQYDASAVEEILSTLPAAIREEKALLEKIGVSVDALVYGFLPNQFQDYYVNAPDHIDGWTFSIEDMDSFGIDNVTYAGGGDYPSERAVADYGVLVLRASADR